MTAGTQRLLPSWVSLRRIGTLAVGRAAAAGIGFLGVAMVARLLSPAELGLWSMALAVQAYALHLGEFGLRSVATAEAARAPAGIGRLLPRYLGLRLGLSLAVLAVLVVGTKLLAPDALTPVTLATAAILPVSLQLDWLALSADRPGLAAGLLLVRPVAFVVLLAPLSSPGSAAAVALVYLGSWWIAAAASWTTLTDLPKGGGSPVDGPLAMLRAGAPLCAVTLTNQMQTAADLLAVGAVLGIATAGDYYLASQIAVAGLVVANAAGQAGLARLAPLAADPQAFRQLLGRELRLVGGLGFVLAAGLGLAAPLVVPVAFGAEHRGAVPLVLWLLPWFVLQHPTTLLQGGLAGIGRGRDVLLGNAVLLAVLLPGLAVAAMTGRAEAFACVRGLGEAARLLVLHRRAFGERLRGPATAELC
ncbi:MAG: lipopolysaccharide biosynthesis protein [Geminicoccaceae bacterium]